jgi:hypothetical protein
VTKKKSLVTINTRSVDLLRTQVKSDTIDHGGGGEWCYCYARGDSAHQTYIHVISFNLTSLLEVATTEVKSSFKQSLL